MTEKDFLSSSYPNIKNEGKSVWKAPSNIALIKYWGKRENQIPANPSLSFTLSSCATTTSVEYRRLEKGGADFDFDLFFEGNPMESFRPKIEIFLKRIEMYLPFLKEYHFKIETSNSFPHSSGIASSASGMAALALCLMDLEKELDPGMEADFFNNKASFLARLGSGSASRSIEGDLILWGADQEFPKSSDLYAIKYPFGVHGVFRNYQDTILLVHKGQKQVSSTVGHDLMHNHPFSEQRFVQARRNLSRIRPILSNGDLPAFVQLVESEALTLHAMMMTGNPYFMLMKPNTLEIINKIWEFRQSTDTNVCFTLDAGANVHVLYPENEKDLVLQFIKNELVVYCENGQYICDQIGFGAERVMGS